MGVISPDKHDVFFSYATLDNRMYRGWIDKFRLDLKERVQISLEQKGYKYDIDQFDFFIDHQGLPANGELAKEITDAIEG